MIKYALLALLVLPLMGLAEAKTATFTEIYKDVYLYGGEYLTIINDDVVPHSITSYNQTHRAFDSGLIQPNGQTNFGFQTDGDYAFYDTRNTSLNGTIHVRTTESPVANIALSASAITAGDTVNIYGEYYPANKDVIIRIDKPDGSELQTLTLRPTTDGKLYVPITTERTSQNGFYKVTEVHGGQVTGFVVSGGVTADNPLVESPPITDGGSSGGSSSPPINNTATNSTITTTDKEVMIAYIKMQIQILEKILAILESQ